MPAQAATTAQQASGRSTIVRLYQAYAPRIEQRFGKDYRQAVVEGLADTLENKQRFFKAIFVFSLVRDQGIFGNLWELVDSYPASDRRMPATMFREAFATATAPTVKQRREEGIAWTPCAGFSHGRCDRLEMEFIALLSFLDVKSEMYMSGPIHVRTEVPLDGRFLVFDNSFSRFAVRKTPGARVRPAQPYDVGYTNRLAHKEAARIATLPLDAQGVHRVERAIEAFLDGKAPSWCADPGTTGPL